MLEVEPTGWRGCTTSGSGRNGRGHIVSLPPMRYLVILENAKKSSVRGIEMARVEASILAQAWK